MTKIGEISCGSLLSPDENDLGRVALDDRIGRDIEVDHGVGGYDHPVSDECVIRHGGARPYPDIVADTDWPLALRPRLDDPAMRADEAIPPDGYSVTSAVDDAADADIGFSSYRHCAAAAANGDE